MSSIDELLRDLDGDALLIRTEHESLRGVVVHSMMLESDLVDGVDFAVVTQEQWYDFSLSLPPSVWYFPVGTVEYPPAKWYAATVHDLTGKKNGGYRHTGIDYNLDISPWGDVDRGMPVRAVADGEVYGVWFSQKNLASVVLEVQHEGASLFVRYWHLARDETFLALRPGQRVVAGQQIGALGAYLRGDHLHFDMALDAFHPGVWFTSAPGTRWVDPVPILKAHLGEEEVEASLARGR